MPRKTRKKQQQYYFQCTFCGTKCNSKKGLTQHINYFEACKRKDALRTNPLALADRLAQNYLPHRPLHTPRLPVDSSVVPQNTLANTHYDRENTTEALGNPPHRAEFPPPGEMDPPDEEDDGFPQAYDDDDGIPPANDVVEDRTTGNSEQTMAISTEILENYKNYSQYGRRNYLRFPSSWVRLRLYARMKSAELRCVAA